jgi:hypothetical protein
MAAPFRRHVGLTILSVSALTSAVAFAAPKTTDHDRPAHPDGDHPAKFLTDADAAWLRGTDQAGEFVRKRDADDAKAERAASRDRYHGMSAESARALVRSQFPQLVAERPINAHEPSPGMEVVRRPDAKTAVVRDEEHPGDEYLLKSTFPMVTAAGDPVNLALVQRDPGVEPSSPLVPVRLGDNLSGGLALLDAGIGLKLATDFDPKGVVDESSEFYADADQDTDVIMRPRPYGGQIMLQLRSQDSPEHFRLQLDLPDGAHLREAKADQEAPGDPPRSVEIYRGGESLAFVTPPVAFDADGWPVDVSAKVVGDDIMLDVDHRRHDLHYPLMVDPEVISTSYNSDWSGWYGNYGDVAGSGAHYIFGINSSYYPQGLYIGMSGSWYTNGGYGIHRFWTPLGTYIYRAIMTWNHAATTYAGVAYSQVFAGLANRAFSAWETGNWGISVNDGATGQNINANPWIVRKSYYTTSDQCFNNSSGGRCDRSQGSDGNLAALGLQACCASGNIAGPASVAVPFAWIYIGDRNAPTMLSTTPGNQGWHNATTGAVTARATDGGLGIIDFLVADNVNGSTTYTTQNLPEYTAGCGDPYRNHCPQDTQNRQVTYSLTEGVHSLTLWSHDISGNYTTGQNWTDRIDRSKPVFSSVSGGVVDNDNNTVRLDSLSLTVDATDGVFGGNGSQLRSGVASITIKDNGVVQGTSPTQTNGADSAPLHRDWTFNPASVAPGSHTITVTATDRVGIESDPRTYHLYVPYYWYHPALAGSYDNQWATNGTGGTATDNVGSGWVNSHSTTGAGYAVQSLPNGDWCNFGNAGVGFTPNNYDYSALTGLTVPSPYSSYQQGNTSPLSNPSVCQGYRYAWGMYLAAGDGEAACTPTSNCNIQHTVGLVQGGTTDLPWATGSGLVLATNFTPKIEYDGASANQAINAWAFLCADLQDVNGPQTGGGQRIIEFCLDLWTPPSSGGSWLRSQNDYRLDGPEASSDWQRDHCQGNSGSAFYFQMAAVGNGETWATAVTGASRFGTPADGVARAYAASISASQFQNAINEAQKCDGVHNPNGAYSASPSQYRLIGLEEGIESVGPLFFMGGSFAALTAYRLS